MRALVVEELLPDYAGVRVKDIPTPDPGPGEVRVKVRAAAVNFPDLSDGLWFLSQFRRWGWLARDNTESEWMQQVADVHGTARYREAAANLLVQVPAAEIRRSVLCDGIVWDGHAPQAYADAFAIRAG